VKNGIVAVHNGIIVNSDKLWDQMDINPEFEIDTEVVLAMIADRISDGMTLIESVKEVYAKIEGTASMCMVFNNLNQLILSTNNGSIYYATDNRDVLIFASEKNILQKVIDKNNLHHRIKDLHLKQLHSNSAILVDLAQFEFTKINFSDSTLVQAQPTLKYETHIESIEVNGDSSKILEYKHIRASKDYEEKRLLLEDNSTAINRLKRCTKCILPETFPYITFDSQGECNYCNNYVQKNQPRDLSELRQLIAPYKSHDGSVDCLVPFSGGRDSTYVLHFVKKELGLNPIAYTYDWGMVTDLARRNIARVCGELGVENIIVAADIDLKRNNIKLNIDAWLKKPDLGMIPLFMAGDKQFFKHANKVKSQNNIDLNIWGINFLENTDFKVGFCGVRPDWDKEMIYSMSFGRKAKLFSHVLKNFINNPSYLNKSLTDTLDSFISRYANPRKDYYHLFDYMQWNEKDIENVLISQYDWEVADDSKSTWRIGDGTASFYNYIYYTVAGFSEFDTFRSNQIREGMISRDEALELVITENKPRYESLRWYLEITGVDYDHAIKTINAMPKLY
jgi:hypothetical protein